MVAKELGETLLVWFKHHGEIVAHNDVRPEISRCSDEITKRRIQLRRATCYVECRNAKAAHGIDNGLRSFARHDFCPARTRIDVAMLAGLITKLADIDLQSIDPRRAQLNAVCRQLLVEIDVGAGRR